jgi:nitrite reductase (NO-forming)
VLDLLAAIRPAGQDFPVLLHIVGATLVFGALLASATSLALARGQARLLRLGYFTLLFVALPGWILMRLSGEWIYRKQGWDSLPDQFQDATWLRIGFIVADGGAILFVLALVVGGIGVNRLRSGKSADLLKVTMTIAIVLALAFVVAVWAMTGKPGQPTVSSAGPPATGAPTQNGGVPVTVTASEFKFELSKANVAHGNVVFTIVNNGKVAHDFSISGKTSPLVSPGESAKFTVTLEAGTFDYLCTVPGHAGAGMKGTLTVT